MRGDERNPKHQSRRRISRTLVKWNWSGSSVLKLTFNPVRKKLGSGLRSYVKNSALLDSGDMAICSVSQGQQALASEEGVVVRTPICLR